MPQLPRILFGVFPLALMLLLAQRVSAGEVPVRSSSAQVSAGAVDILTPESYWRWFLTLRKPIIPVAALKAAGQEAAGSSPLVGTVVPPPYNQVDQQESPPAPADWETPALDDFGWPRSRLTWLAPNAFGRFSSAVLCLRGRFQVTDPGTVQGLTLTVKYYGGVRVFLNGREVARQHLPAGDLAADTPAEMYSRDVYLDSRGVIVPMGDHEYRWSSIPASRRKDAEQRRARRTRVLGPLKLPSDLIRRGENVIAIEVRRSEYPFEALRWFKRPEGTTKPFWVPMNILDLHLQAAGDGISANVARPKGVQVWTENTNDRITPLDYGDAGEGLRPMRIVGARNGTFCGQLVIGCDQAFRGARVSVGNLRAIKGGGIIPAANATLLYALPDISYYGKPTWFDALQNKPPAEVAVARRPPGTGGPPGDVGALLPVLLRVKVPRDAPAGDYRGEAVVTIAGHEVARVPIHLSVADWTVPDPADYRTYVGVYQSPTSLALQYKVPEWSEEHWKLMEKSFALLARTGNRLVNVTVVDETQFGNDEGMIYWIKRPDGSYTYDFKVFDRYLDLARKHFSLEFVILHVWHSGGWETRQANQRNTVTVIDEKTGTRRHLQVPVFGTEESKQFWKPLLEGVHARLARHGLEKAMTLGILSDGTAPREVFAAFDEITPDGARWMRGCHSGTYSEKPDRLPGGGVTVLHEFCYGTPLELARPLGSYWRQRHWPGTDYERLSGHEAVAALSWYRETGMTALMRRTRGVGRICLDFFDVLREASPGGGGVGSVRTIYNRFPHSSCAQREPSLKRMAWPGLDGPATTLRYEAFCEGIQFAEALLVVSEAIDTKAAELGPERTEQYRQLLTDLWRRAVRAGWHAALRPNHEGWQIMFQRLFDAAGESARIRRVSLLSPASQVTRFPPASDDTSGQRP